VCLRIVALGRGRQIQRGKNIARAPAAAHAPTCCSCCDGGGYGGGGGLYVCCSAKPTAPGYSAGGPRFNDCGRRACERASIQACVRALSHIHRQTSKQTEEQASLNCHRCETTQFFVGSAMTHIRIALFTSFWIIHVQVLCASFRNIRVLFAYIIFSTYSTIHIHRCLNCCCGGGGVLCHMYTAMSVKKNHSYPFVHFWRTI
jgi:hypothetical protein